MPRPGENLVPRGDEGERFLSRKREGMSKIFIFNQLEVLKHAFESP